MIPPLAAKENIDNQTKSKDKVMTNGNRKKYEMLGISVGAATHQLRKEILFSLVRETGKDVCYRCGKKIEDADNFSIEHKEPWQQAKDPKRAFYDLNNIAFSHLSCNAAAASRDKESLRKISQDAFRSGRRNSKLSEKDIKDIRELLKTKTQKEVAEMYGVTKFAIYRIANNISFGYVK